MRPRRISPEFLAHADDTGVLMALLQSRYLPRLQRAWSEQTAHHSVVPLEPDDDSSRGQCGVSSVWTARQLCGEGYEAVVAEGMLQLTPDYFEPYVWVEVARARGGPLVVDVANRQFHELQRDGWYVGQTGQDDTDEPVGSFVRPRVYWADTWHNPFDVPRKKLMRRYQLLEEAIQHPYRQRGRRVLGTVRAWAEWQMLQ